MSSYLTVVRLRSVACARASALNFSRNISVALATRMTASLATWFTSGSSFMMRFTAALGMSRLSTPPPLGFSPSPASLVRGLDGASGGGGVSTCMGLAAGGTAAGATRGGAA